jgi:hypothetical protein
MATYVGGGVGRLFPKGATQVRLAREELAIDLSTEHVTARYTLANPGPELTAEYAVPIILPRPAGGGPAQVTTSAKQIADSITISLDGKRQGCAFRSVDASYHVYLDDLDVMGTRLSKLALVAGLCVTTLHLPKGSSIRLELSFQSPLFWTKLDSCVAATGECQNDPPTAPAFYYPMGAASSWAGKPSRIDVAIELGEYRFERERSEGIPPEAKARKGTLTWAWTNPNMVGMDFLLALSERGKEGGIEARSRLGNLCTLNLRPVRSSTQAAPAAGFSYGADKLVDGLAATSWCVNTPRNGIGEWVEVQVPVAKSELGFSGRDRSYDKSYSNFFGLEILPGLGAGQRLWEANGRVNKVKLGLCDQKAPMLEASVKIADGFLDSMVEVPDAKDFLLDSLLDAKGDTICLRLEIAGVLPGTKSKDVCLSELAVANRCE